MTLIQRISLLWRRFTPLEERLLDAVREILPSESRPLFDAQVAAITLVQRHANEICFYRKASGKVDWSGVPLFPRTTEFRLASVSFRVGGKRFKATLTCIGGHLFDFAVTPNPKAIAFSDWDAAPSAGLLNDPLAPDASLESHPVPELWRKFLDQHREPVHGWTFHDSGTAYIATFADGEFLILAERDGDQFVMHRLESPDSPLLFVDSHDGTPEPIHGDIAGVFQTTGNRNA